MQSQRASLLEATANALSGLLTANLTWVYIIAPAWGFHNTRDEVLAINIIFTIVSIARSYLWRRLFNWFEQKGWYK